MDGNTKARAELKSIFENLLKFSTINSNLVKIYKRLISFLKENYKIFKKVILNNANKIINLAKFINANFILIRKSKNALSIELYNVILRLLCLIKKDSEKVHIFLTKERDNTFMALISKQSEEDIYLRRFYLVFFNFCKLNGVSFKKAFSLENYEKLFLLALSFVKKQTTTIERTESDLLSCFKVIEIFKDKYFAQLEDQTFIERINEVFKKKDEVVDLTIDVQMELTTFEKEVKYCYIAVKRIFLFYNSFQLSPFNKTFLCLKETYFFTEGFEKTYIIFNG